MKRHRTIGGVAVLLVLILSTGLGAQTTGISGDSTINQCETKTYTISVQNSSGNDLTNLAVLARLENLTGFSYVAGTAALDIDGTPLCTADPTISGGYGGLCSPAPGTPYLAWDIDGLCGATTLANGETLNVTFDLQTDCDAVSGSLNTYIDYQVLGTPMCDNTGVLNIQVNPGAVTIKKTPNVIPQVLGQDVTWTLTIENTGFGVIENVEVTDVLGDGLAYVSSTENGNNAGQTTTWTSNEFADLASMDPGDILSIDITATVIACQNLDNNADVRFGCAPSPANTCFNTADDGGTATASVQRIVRSPNIAFTPPDINFTHCGDTETVSFAITNIGDGVAYDVYTIVDLTGFTVSNVSAGAIYNVAQTRFELAAPLAASGDPGDSYNLSFDLIYSGWCGGGFPSGDLLWQKLYKDACDQEFYPPVELSTINAPASAASLSVSKTGGPVEIEIGDPITYTITSSYTGPVNCGDPSNPTGLITVVDTLPNGFTVTDAGGGTWVPGSGGTGGTITWTYLPPAELDTTITVQSPGATQCEAFCNTVFDNSVSASGTDCCGCALSADDSQTTAIECAEGLTSDKTSSAPTERCADTTYTNTYVFDGGSAMVLSDLVFTEEANLEQLYNGNLAITLTGSGDITGLAALTDTTPGVGGTLVLDFNGAPATSLAGQTLTIVYDLTATEDTIAACGGASFYSWSSLDMGTTGSECLADGVIHETVPVSLGSPAMSLAITGLGRIFNTCETKTITQTLTQTSGFNPRDARLVLSGLNYYVTNPAATICGGIAPVSCTPVIDGSGDYVWTFNDAFTGSGQSSTIQLEVQKRCGGTGDLVATAYFDDFCADDATPDELCLVVATETPALLLSGDLLIEKTPEVYYANTDTVQWEIYITNRGTGTAYNVWVDDVLGSGLLYEHGVNPIVVDNMTGVTINDSLDHTGGAINGASVEIASMAAGERRQITFIARQVDCNNLTNDVTANWGCIGVDCQTDITDSSIVSIPAPNLINANTITPANGIDACENPRGFITLRNAGQVYTYNLQVTETLPAGLTYVSGTTRWRINGGGWNGPNIAYDPSPTVSPLVWTSTEIPQLASAAPGDTIEIEFDMVSDCPFAGGDISVATQYENPCADVFNTSDSTFTVTFNEPDILVAKTRADDPIGCNEAIQWTITVTNNSGYLLPVIWVEDTLDAAFTFVSAVGDATYGSDNGNQVGQVITWELENVPHGATATIILNATTDSSPCSADLDNTVVAYWGCGAVDGDSSTKPPPSGNPCLTISGVTDVRTETREPTVGFQGTIGLDPTTIDTCNDSTEMTVTIHNSGPTNATDLDLVVTLPANLEFILGSAAFCTGVDDTCTPVGGIGNPAETPIGGGRTNLTFWDIGDKGNNLADLLQADGGTDTLVLVFDVTTSCYTSDDVEFTLYYYDCCDDTQYTTDDTFTLTADFPQLAITKNPRTALIDCATGSQEWVFTVTNNGTGNAQVVRVEDTPGAWLTMQMGTFNDVDGTGATIADLGGGVYGWEFVNLAAGNSAEFRVSTQLNPDYGLTGQANCNEIYRQNNTEAVWGCGVSGDATDLDATTTAYDCTDSTPASATATTLQMPNLVVTTITPTITCTTDGNVSGSITVRVTNNGDGATSGDFSIQVTDGKGWTGTGTHSGAIAAGGFVDVTINTATWNPECNCIAPYSFNATVDTGNAICECNEDDNSTASATNYAPPIPELTITDIDFSNVTCTSDGISGNVRVQVENTGCGAAANFQVALLTDGCLTFTPQTVANLAANSATWVTFTISGNWADCTDGSCDFTATVDQPDTVCECDGTNNSRTETYDSPLPDLTVTDIDFTGLTCTNDGYAGSVAVTVQNQGPGTANNIPVGLGTDGCLTFAGTQTIAALASGASSTVTFNVTGAWADCSDGSCDFTATVDPSNTICECDGTNNARAETYDNTLPDLAVNSVTPLATCTTDGTVGGRVTVNVSNTGFSDVTGAVVQLVSTCGIVFVNQTVNLAAGASTDLTFNYTPTAANCNCTFIATIDPANAVCECTNTNNSVVSSPYVSQIPDLLVSSDTLGATCSADGQVTVAGNLTVQNNGCGSNLTSDIPVRLTLYDNTGCSGNVVGTWSTTLSSVSIASGGGTQTFTLPDQTLIADFVANSTGCQFSIGVELDHTNTICEFDGTNNTYCADNKPVDIPDLRGQSDTLGATCSTDGTVSVAGTVTVANDGCGSNLTGDIPVRLTLYDNTGGTGAQLDQWTETLSAVNIAAGGGTQTFTLTPRAVDTDLVANSTGCQFSIRVEYDYSGTICESDAANNTWIADNKGVDIPDLGVSTDTLTVTCLDDGQARISGSVTLVNDGCGSNLTDNVPLRLTLFGDAGCSGAQVDQWAETVTGINIPAGGGTQTFSITNRDITTDLCGASTNNTMSVRVEADEPNAICESDGTDNTRCADKTVAAPDLTVTSVATTVTCQTDGSIAGTTVSVANTGCGDALGSVVRLTSDCGLTFTDQTVDLTAGATADVFFPFTSGFTDCNCNFSAQIDPENAICETDDTNNSGSSTDPLLVPDLEVAGQDLSFQCLGDGQYQIDGTVTLVNNGCGPDLTDNIRMRFTLSAGADCGGPNLSRWTQTFTGVSLPSAGGTQTFNVSAHGFDGNLCGQSSTCQYSMNVEADYNDAICEWDGTDNELCAPIEVAVPNLSVTRVVPDLSCDADQRLQGIVTVDVVNDGCGDVTGAEVRLTSDCGLDLGMRTLDLPAGSAGNVVFRVEDALQDCTDCDCRFTAQVDPADAVCECLADDNRAARDTEYQCEPREGDSGDWNLSLEKTSSSGAVLPGSLVQFSLRITNTGSADATDIEVHDTLPAALAYVPGTSALDSVPLDDPAGGPTLTWTLPRVAAGETVQLVYRTVARSDARPGRHLNTARINGEPPATSGVFVGDPSEGQCCLRIEKEMVAHGSPPDVMRAEPELYFQTDMAMFASAEFVRLQRELGPWLESAGLDHDPAELVTGLYRRVLRQGDWYAHFNLGNLTMGSGMGLSMAQAPDVVARARREDRPPSEVVAETLAKWAREAGLKETPQIAPLLMAYYAGAPFYEEGIESGQRTWDVRDRDAGLVPSAWGLTLLRQAQALDQRLAGDAFLSRVTAWQMVQTVKWVHGHLSHTRTPSQPLTYLPHRWSLEQEKNAPAKSTGKDERFSLTLEDSSSHLLDQAAALWGLSAMRAVFKNHQITPPDELQVLMEIAWQGLETLHLDSASGVYIDRHVVGSEEGADGERHAQPLSLMMTALALEDLARHNSDLKIATQATQRLEAMRAFVAQKMVSEEGAGAAYDLESDRRIGEEHTLGNQFALMRVLLTRVPPTWLQKLTGQQPDPALAIKMYTFAENHLWDPEYGIYRDSDQGHTENRFTPFDIGAVVGVFRELLPQVPNDQRNQLLDRLAATFEKVVERSQMQLSQWRRIDADRPLPPAIDPGYRVRRPLPLPAHRYNSDDTSSEALRDLAPVLVRAVTLSLIPPEADQVARKIEQQDQTDPGALDTHWADKSRPTMTPRRPFHTATGMLASRQLWEAAEILSTMGFKTDNAYLVDPLLSSHFSAILKELARAGLIRLTLHSGNGLPLHYAGLSVGDAARSGQALQDRLQKLARQAGLESMPVVPNPTAIEYSQGVPQYRDGLGGGWEQRQADPIVSVAGVAQTLLHQLHFLHQGRRGQTPAQPELDRFLASVAGLQVAAKIDFLKTVLQRTPDQLPETLRLVVDSYGRTLDVEIETPQAVLLTRLSMFQALGEVAFADSEDLALIPNGKTLADDCRALFERQWPQLQAAFGLDRDPVSLPAEATLLDTGLALDTLARLYGKVPAEDPWRASLATAGRALVQWALEQEDADESALAGRSAMLIGLWQWFEIGPSEEFRKAVLKRHGRLLRDAWDPDLGLFHNPTHQTHLQHTGIRRYQYSDLDIGMTVSALIHTLPHLDGAAQRDEIDRLTGFGGQMLSGSGLDLDRFETNRLADKTQDIEPIRGVDLLVTDHQNLYPEEIATFRIWVDNRCLDLTTRSGPLHRLRITDQLPAGMVYLPGSSRVNDVTVTPSRMGDRRLTWWVDALDEGQTAVITFRARILEDAGRGDDVNIAWAEGWTGEAESWGSNSRNWSCRTGEDREPHTVGLPGRIEGRVFMDLDQDGRQGAAEQGISEIRLRLNGRQAVTTSGDGSYRFDALKPGVYDLRLDWSSLPESLRPVSDPVAHLILEEGGRGVFHLALLRTRNVEALVYEDRNENGVRDPGEPGVPAVNIGLKNSPRHAFSAHDGFVRIDGVPVGIPADVLVKKAQPYLEGGRWTLEKIALAPWKAP